MSWTDRLFSWTGAAGPPSAPSPAPAASVGPGAGSLASWCPADGPLADWLRGGEGNAAGRAVTERSALRNPTFFRAASLVAGTVGMLPINLMRRRGETIERADDHPAHRLLRTKPNGFQTPYQFKSYMQGRALLLGNAYAHVVPGLRGPQALVPMDPARTRIEIDDLGEPVYRWRRKDGRERVFAKAEILHLRAPWSSDGVHGDGLLKVAEEVLALAHITDEASARLLRNGSYVGGVLEHPKNLSEEAAARLRGQFEERFTGVENRGRWIVAEEGLQAKPLGVTGRDAEGAAQRRLSAEDISRITGVPRPLLNFDETSWGTGIEQLGLFFITYCLLPWFVAWEEVLADTLLTPAERDAGLYVKINEAALLRGSLKDQAEFLAKALGGPGATGFMVPNEARDKMDMNPIPNGDQPGWGSQETDR